MEILQNILKWIYPPTCLVCEDVLPVNTANYLCENCKDSLSPINEPVCSICGAPQYNHLFCINCAQRQFSFCQNISAFLYDDVMREIIHALKYDKKSGLGIVLGEILADYIYGKMNFTSIDYIIPVPIHKNKLNQRGFNQAELLAKPVGAKLNIPIISKALIRSVDSGPQSLVSLEKREENVKDCFKFNYNFEISGKNIMVIDDIFTTGSTMESVTKVLLAQGAGRVISTTLSISPLEKQ